MITLYALFVVAILTKGLTVEFSVIAVVGYYPHRFAYDCHSGF